MVRKNIYHIVSFHVAVSQWACEASWMGGWGEGGMGGWVGATIYKIIIKLEH